MTRMDQLTLQQKCRTRKCPYCTKMAPIMADIFAIKRCELKPGTVMLCTLCCEVSRIGCKGQLQKITVGDAVELTMEGVLHNIYAQQHKYRLMRN